VSLSDSSRRHFLRTAGLAATAGMLPPSIARALAIPADRRTGTIRDVQHIVILMQENRSFDHYYGTLRGVRGFGDPHPVPLPGGRPVWEQQGKDGRVITPFHLDTRATAALKITDLPHSWEDANGARREGRWDGWIPSKTELTMGHYRREDIAFQFALAEAFTICDAYHCSVHGQTNPNRLFIWAGGNDPRATGGGPVVANSSGVALDYETVITPEMEEASKRYKIDLRNYGKGPRYSYTTYPERLEAAGISWKVYQDPKDNFWGLTNPAVAFKAYNDAKPGEPLHDKAMALHSLDELRHDVAAGTLPQVSWIACPQARSEHPAGSSPIEGADLTAEVLDALTSNPEIWSRTVLFLTFDENDGFFDHVTPPAPPAVLADGARAGASTVSTDDDIHPQDRLPYGLSVRVPMTVISPWSTGGWVNSQVFDHTSVIRFVETRFGVMEPNITPWRRAVCGDLTSAFDFAKPSANHARLPAIDDARGQAAAALKLPPVAPPASNMPLFQEAGVRPSRALPYALDLEEVVRDGSLHLTFRNPGATTVVFQVNDLTHPDTVPRHYTVEPGKALTDAWPAAGGYRLEIRGPNQWYRELAGRSADSFAPALRVVAGRLHVTVRGDGAGLVWLDHLAGAPLPERGGSPDPERSIPLAERGNWYDVTIEGGGFRRRMSGRIETGRDGISRPPSRG
jgi:phospholipase C